MNKPLTWQQFLIVFCGIGLIAASAFAWGSDISPAYQARGLIAFWALIGCIVLLLWSHWRKATRADLVPDVLAGLFPPDQQFQVGPTHFVIDLRQVGRWLHLTVVIQNLKDGEGRFRLRIEPELRRAFQLSHRDVFAVYPAELDCLLPPAAVVLATSRVPLKPIADGGEVRLWPHLRASANGSAVRFGRRTVIRKRTSGWVTALALLGGHLHAGGGTFLRFNYVARAGDGFGIEVDDASVAEWQAVTLWTPDASTSVADMNQVLAESMPAW